MKKGDKIYVVQGDKLSYAEVIGFYSHCIYLRVAEVNRSLPPYHQGLFYGFSYSGEGMRYLYLKKWWHYFGAKVVEQIRRKLPRKISRMLKLEK